MKVPQTAAAAAAIVQANNPSCNNSSFDQWLAWMQFRQIRRGCPPKLF